MAKSEVVAAGWLAVVFLWTSYVMLLVEPGMGFQTPADFLDPAKVAIGNASVYWLISNLLYLSVPVAVMTVVVSADDRLVQWSGLATSILWLVLGSMDRVGIQLPDLMVSDEAVLAAIAAMLPVRFAILKASAFSFGAFAWSVTRVDRRAGTGPRLWRALGWLILLSSVAFLFVFLPVPIAYALWAVAFTATGLRSGAAGAASG